MEKFKKKRVFLGGFAFLCLLLLLLLPMQGRARTATHQASPPLAKTAQSDHFGTRYIRHGLDVNDFRVPMTNYSIFGQFVELGAAGGEWPKGSNEFYIFGAGLWVGGTVNRPSLQTLAFGNPRSSIRRDSLLYLTVIDTLAPGGTYPTVVIGYEPSGGAEEFSGLTDIFISGHPEDYDDPDYWPLRNEDGSPLIVGIQDSYTEYDDQDIERWDIGDASNAGDGVDIAKYGLGIKVIQRTHSWNYENNKTIHFFIFDIVNMRQDKAPIRNCFLTVMCDADVGPTANDDLVGFDASRNLGYCYDYDRAEQGFARIPGFLAYKFLESPVATYDVDLNGDDQISDDSIDVNSDGVWVKDVRRGEPLGLTSFKTSNLQSGDPDTEAEKFLIMAGHNYPDVADQRYAPFDLGTGTSPVDQRFFQNTGPFLLAAVGDTVVDTVWAYDPKGDSLKIASIETIEGDTVRVVVAVLMAPDEEQLPQVADIAQSIYDIGFILPRPPDHPDVWLVPDDRKVFISWDDRAEHSQDPYYKFTSDPENALYDPLYEEVDFEGYRLYRSRSGLPGTFELLASWDKSSVTPRHVDIEQLSGPGFEGSVTYDEFWTENWFLAVYGTELFTGQDYLVQVKTDGSFFVSNLTLGTDIPASDEQEHWYFHGEPPYVFEVFSWDVNPIFSENDEDSLPTSRSTAERVADGTYDDYFDGCWLLVGGMAIQFSGDVPSEEVVFRITAHLEEAEGENQEVSHSYIDSGLINGVTYYYDVIAYDFQPFSSPRSLENGITGIAVTPRSHAAGLVEGTAYDVEHAAGSSDGSVEVLVVQPDSVTGHDYEVGFHEGDPPLLWYLKDLQTGQNVLDNMSNQSGNDDYPVVNGMVVKVAGPELGIASWEYLPSGNRWITGVNWGGGYFFGGLDLGSIFFGSSIEPAEYVTIEVRFSATERQKAYDYLRGGDPSYGYIGYFEVPFTVWDMTADPPRQINAAFVENNGQPEYDSTWGPSLSTNGREYLFILLSDYSETPLEYYTTRRIYHDAEEFDVLYAGWFVARADEEGNARTWTEGDVFRITPFFINLASDKFTFKTNKKRVDENLVDLGQIRVVPNPYIVRNAWEPSRDYSRIAFTHLPEKCTIRIYTLSGDLLQTLEHESATFDGNENWDLLTKNNQKIAAGIYIYHVDSEYGEKIGKFAVVR
ncbi:MAG: hypothetical protein AMJ73_02970 [candidate division Zixibacteria bacterium SM1_73]|nr:MAG: hypothetical protein AMJ73_02970 [candidate division Zixibacteria bacterium SM1_73]